MDSFSSPVFSLKRFFHKKKESWPCWLAGRFYPKQTSRYELQSQGLSVLCEITGNEPSIKAGAWVMAKLISKKNNVYQTKELRLLNPRACSKLASGFSYKNQGQTQQDWQDLLNTVREFFKIKGLACVKTPGLVLCPGTEPHLQVFDTAWKLNGRSQKMYLPTSPEMHLKKLLCQDWTDFFEIKQCYRNGELSAYHQPEFSLLEWYRAFYSTKDLIEETYELLSFLQNKVHQVSLPPPQIYTVSQLFQKHLNFSFTPQTSQQDLMNLLKAQELKNLRESSFEDLFFLLFLNHIEPKIPKTAPFFICDYPPQLRAFSRLNQDGWSDRFELYWQGIELANAFYEVIEPKEQKQLFEGHLKLRKDLVPMDEELILLMEQGMPPCSGIAMGLDRLFLALYKKKDLKEIRLFPF